MSTTVNANYAENMTRHGPCLLYAALLLGGTYAAFRPTFDSGFARMQTDLGDTILNHYLLEHTWQVVSNPDYRGTLLSPPFYFPQPLVLGYSENFLGVAPAYWAFRLGAAVRPGLPVVDDRDGGLKLRGLRGRGPVARLPASGGRGLRGYMWAFGLVHIAQIGHQQMIPRFWCPLALYHAWGWCSAPNLAHSVGSAARSRSRQ